MNQDIMELINRKRTLERELSNLVYGSAEIREHSGNKYLYVHYRDAGRLHTNYVGEYSEELHNVILTNTAHARELKKEIKDLTDRISATGYTDQPTTDDKVLTNIDFAKRNLVDTIYTQAVLEGVATTYADTEDIINGGKVSNMAPLDIQKIVNLKHAWEFVLNEHTISCPSDLGLLCEINRIVLETQFHNAGKLRSVPVKIGGTRWEPDLPIESQVKEQLAELLNKKSSHTDKAISLLLYVMRHQLFVDGNKRTAIIFANHYLISHGAGLLVIPAELADEFKSILVKYYETGNKTDISTFLKSSCYLQI